MGISPHRTKSTHRHAAPSVSALSALTPVPSDAGSDDDDTDDEDEELRSVDALEDQFQDLEEEVATLVADVHDLALYTKLNITGFMKILKVRPRHSRVLHSCLARSVSQLPCTET